MHAYEHILQTYEAVSAKSGQMVDAAQQGDWDRLAALNSDCKILVDALRRADEGSPRPDRSYTKRKLALMRKVLADDAEIRRHTEPWMTRLQAYLGGAGRQRCAHPAYAAGCCDQC
jgi:flagellar protein FliT